MSRRDRDRAFSVANLPPEQRVIVLAAAPRLDASRLSEAAGEVRDWPLALDGARRHRIAPLLAARVTGLALPLPEETSRSLAAIVCDARNNDMAQLLVTGQVLDALRGRGVEALLLKGLGLAERYYDAPWQRASRDMDLLVRRDELPAAREALAACGFSRPPQRIPESERAQEGWRHATRSVAATAELHWEVTPASYPVQMNTSSWWERATLQELRGGRVLVPHPVDALVHLAWHALQGGCGCLRDLGDVARAWARVAQGGPMSEAIDAARACGAGSFLAAALGLGSQLWGDPEAPPVLGNPGFVSRRLRRAVLAPALVVERGEQLWWPVAGWGHFALLDARDARLGYAVRRITLNVASAHEPKGDPLLRLKIASVFAGTGLVTVLAGRVPQPLRTR
ncbi:MAG: nucleotidyltransferase family protein [Acidobacteria bacterium]|nr:nucleotidyltransferase family protein [Acidobacteriota bacterium]